MRTCQVLAAIAGSVLLAAGGCGFRDDVDPDEVLPALEKLPYEYSYRHVGRPPRTEGVVAGRARDRSGVTLDFAVVIHDLDDGRAESLPVVPHGLSGASCANYTVISNADEDPGATEEGRMRREMGIDIELAVRRLAPDFHCEG